MVNSTTPVLKKDQEHNLIQDSYQERAFNGEYATSNLIYEGYAKPGTPTSAAAWQIAKHTYTGSNRTATQWPQIGGVGSSEYSFVWDNRASYTYS